jgi:hypothetical protein
MASARRKAKKIQYDGGLCAGHLMVWTWRKFVAGHADCLVLTREYQRFAGDEAPALLAAFGAFLQALGYGSRRMLAIGRPHCVGLTADEQHILRLMAAAQNGEDARLEAHLCWLVKAGHEPATLGALRMLADRLTVCGVKLPQAAYAPPPPRPMLEVVRAAARM